MIKLEPMKEHLINEFKEMYLKDLMTLDDFIDCIKRVCTYKKED